VIAAADSGIPDGYRGCAIGGTLVVAREEHFQSVVNALGFGTLHAWASVQPGAKAMQGRGVAWATQLPNGPRVVVRHSWHGGMLRHITRDLFLPPTRAAHELRTAARLRASGIQSPDVIAYATYSALGPLCRADVVTAWIDGADLPTTWSGLDPDRRALVCDAVGALIADISEARARHHDFNAKNIIIKWEGETPRAWVLDVDRVTFEQATHAIASMNARRLGQSIHKLRTRASFVFDDASWARILERARVTAAAAPLAP
jgi:tRNA A-37 threonylcarbamoyl transferase component Bud32